MRRNSLHLLICLIAVGLLSCSSSDRIDATEGGVILRITDFDGVPVAVGVNALVALNGGFVQFGSITLSNVPKDPGGVTSDLMDVELKSYEVTFSRSDSGTRTPPAQVRQIFGLVPVGGTDVIINLPFVGPEQIFNPPLSDLLLANGGVDQETGSSTILLDVQFQFFGETLGGDAVTTPRESFTIEFLP